MPICSQNEQYVNDACQCIYGYYRVNNICSICQNGLIYSQSYQDCILNCTTY